MTAIVARDFPATVCWNMNPNQHCRSYIGTISVGCIRNGQRRRITIKASARNYEFRFRFRSIVVPLPPPADLLDIPFGLGAVRKPIPCATNRQHRPECFSPIPKELSGWNCPLWTRGRERWIRRKRCEASSRP